MKKSLLLVCSIVTLFLTTACGGGAITNEKVEKSSDNKDDEIILELWHTYTGGTKLDVINNAIERFEADNPGVKVKSTTTRNDNFKQQMTVAMTGGDPPDVFLNYGGDWLGEFVDGDKIIDLSEDGVDTERFLEMTLESSQFNGGQYGLPLGLTLHLTFYNKDIFEKLHLEAPETYSDLLNTIDVLKENEYIPYAFANQTSWPGSFYYMYLVDRIAGEDLFKEAIEGNESFENEAFVKAGEYIKELVEADAFNPGFNGFPPDSGHARQLIYTEQAVMLMMNTNFLDNAKEEFSEIVEKLDFFSFPALEEGKGDVNNLNGATSPVFSAYSGSDHPDLAAELIEYLTSKETAQEWVDLTNELSAIEGIRTDDPVFQKLSDYAEKADFIQMPYDQTLPPSLAQVHLDTLQEIFGLSMTPEEAAKQMEVEAEKIRSRK
ncbi:ABC transporter substrate-binding protein [Oceanobacillus neutriphilus]|uniref:ABC transporter extracellular-binding protein YurO n=1 Tax=Oceanobacillus neutriphilus TaxID=531815 RepID=A0ABQ2P2C8_9BACI|nr:extracellular solute-binding protein [Oceanobacillus neutriphilus]GGP16396.1 putative ABC transporter extracellular-binding protein YurO [Oceanobacillus neutriphilus]